MNLFNAEDLHQASLDLCIKLSNTENAIENMRICS